MLLNNNGMLTFQNYTPWIHYFKQLMGRLQYYPTMQYILEIPGVSQTINAYLVNGFGTQFKVACFEVYESNIQQCMTRDGRIGVEICP